MPRLFADSPPVRCSFAAEKALDRTNPTLIEITYSFDQSDDVTEQTIGDITGVAKAGWQYLWVQYRETDDMDAKSFAQRPVAAYVEKVYEATSFAELGIGD